MEGCVDPGLRGRFEARVLGALGEERTPVSLAGAVSSLQELAEQELGEQVSARELAHVACHAGCGTCCMVNVAVLFPEVVAIVRYLEAAWEGAALKDMEDRLEALCRDTRWLDEEERLFTRRSCVFLDPGGSCSVYPVRPLLCRSITSTDPGTCREVLSAMVFGNQVPVQMNLAQKEIMDTAFVALAAALETAGLDSRGGRLAEMLRFLLASPEALDAYLQGAPLPRI